MLLLKYKQGENAMKIIKTKKCPKCSKLHTVTVFLNNTDCPGATVFRATGMDYSYHILCECYTVISFTRFCNKAHEEIQKYRIQQEKENN
jgi:hypothetical protein